MKNTFFKIAAMAMLIIFVSACSKKSTEANTPPERPQRKEAPRGQRGGGAPQFSDLLSKMDANKDGKLSKAEVEGPLKNDFSKVDKNDDGFISETEFKDAPRPPRRGGS